LKRGGSSKELSTNRILYHTIKSYLPPDDKNNCSAKEEESQLSKSVKFEVPG